MLSWNWKRPTPYSPGTFEILYSLGQTLLRNSEYRQADLVLNRALALKPESPETLYLLAQVLANESRPMDALTLLVLRAQNRRREYRHYPADGPDQHFSELF